MDGAQGQRPQLIRRRNASDASKQDAVESIRDLLRFRISVLKYVTASDKIYDENATTELVGLKKHMAEAANVTDGSMFPETVEIYPACSTNRVLRSSRFTD